MIALAVTSKDRSAIVPDVPTMAESGYGGFDAVGWHGILAPAHTPPGIVARLNAEIVEALKDPETRALLEGQAMQIVGSSAQAFADFIKHCGLEARRGAGQNRGKIVRSLPSGVHPHWDAQANLFELSAVIAFRTETESLTQPNIPPWALIMFRPISWNSGK